MEMIWDYYACACCSGIFEDRDEHAPVGALCEDCVRDGVSIGDGPDGCTYAIYCEELAASEEEAWEARTNR